MLNGALRSSMVTIGSTVIVKGGYFKESTVCIIRKISDDAISFVEDGNGFFTIGKGRLKDYSIEFKDNALRVRIFDLAIYLSTNDVDLLIKDYLGNDLFNLSDDDIARAIIKYLGR